MKRVFVLTFSESGETTVEGVYATAQAAATAVSLDYDDDADRFMQDAAGLDAWEEVDPDTIKYNNLYLGPGPTWTISKREVEQERDLATYPTLGTPADQGRWAVEEDDRTARPTVNDIGPLFLELGFCPGCSRDVCICDQQPDSCPLCGHEVEEGTNGVVRTVDLDPGDRESGPRPDIQDCLVHRRCPKGPKAWEL